MMEKTTPVFEPIKTSSDKKDFKEISFMDLLGFLISIKEFVFSGIGAGLLLGGLLAFYLGKEGYYSRFYLKADYTKYPAMESQKEVSELLNKLFYSLYGAEVIYNTLSNPAEMFSSKLEGKKISKEDFILSFSENDSNYYFKLVGLSASDEYMFDVILPVSGFDQSNVTVVETLINNLINSYNHQLKQNYETRKNTRLDQAKSNYDVAESMYSKSILDVFEQLQKYRQEMVDIEYKLISRLPEDIKRRHKDFLEGAFDGNLQSKIVIPMEMQGSSQTSAPVDSIKNNIKSLLSKDMDRMVRIAILLKESDKTGEIKSIQHEIDRIYDIQKEIAAIDNGKKIAEAKIAMQASSMNLEKVGGIISEVFDESKVFLPHFDLNPTLVPSKESSMRFEIKTSNRLRIFIKTFLAIFLLSVFLGLIQAVYKKYR